MKAGIRQRKTAQRGKTFTHRENLMPWFSTSATLVSSPLNHMYVLSAMIWKETGSQNNLGVIPGRKPVFMVIFSLKAHCVTFTRI